MAWIAAFLLTLGMADASALFGEWTGESKCVGAQPACKDEQNVYVLTPSSEAGAVHVVAYKIINGERVEMGQSDYRYDDRTHHLTWDFTAGTTHRVWDLVVTGTTMQGALTHLPDKTVARQVTLRKSGS
jgi:hypothetical protein